MIEDLEKRFREIAPDVDYCSLRYESETGESVSVRRNVLQPVSDQTDAGAMITVAHGGGLGYAATSDLTTSGLKEAARRAQAWAARTAGSSVADFSSLPHSNAQGTYESHIERPWMGLSLPDRIDLIREQCERLKSDDRIVEWYAGVSFSDSETLYVNNHGARTHQRFQFLVPVMAVTANQGAETETRTLGGYGNGRQGARDPRRDRLQDRGAAPRG